MPSSKIHERTNIIFLAAFLILLSPSPIFHERLLLLLFSISYIFGTYYLSPDLDTNSKPYKRWKSLRIFWYPIKRFIKHRSYTHHFIYGPILIVGYFMLLVLPLIVLLDMHFKGIQTVFMGFPIVLGIITSIELHILLDVLWSYIKKVSKIRR